MNRAPTTRNAKAVQRTNHQTSVQQFEIHQGPLPAPEIIEQYERVLPGSAERLLRMVEQEGEHRRALESRQLRSQIMETHIGQWMAFMIGMFTIAAGAYTAMHGAEWPGAVMGSGGVIGLVAVFIYGRKSQ